MARPAPRSGAGPNRRGSSAAACPVAAAMSSRSSAAAAACGRIRRVDTDGPAVAGLMAAVAAVSRRAAAVSEQVRAPAAALGYAQWLGSSVLQHS